jgi:hypothetical protein
MVSKKFDSVKFYFEPDKKNFAVIINLLYRINTSRGYVRHFFFSLIFPNAPGGRPPEKSRRRWPREAGGQERGASQRPGARVGGGVTDEGGRRGRLRGGGREETKKGAKRPPTGTAGAPGPRKGSPGPGKAPWSRKDNEPVPNKTRQVKSFYFFYHGAKFNFTSVRRGGRRRAGQDPAPAEASRADGKSAGRHFSQREQW